MKVNDEAAAERPLNDEVAPTPKVNRHVRIALDHMGKRRSALIAARTKLDKEITELDAAILALG